MTYGINVLGEILYTTKWLADAEILIDLLGLLDCVVIDTTTGEVVRIYERGSIIYRA